MCSLEDWVIAPRRFLKRADNNNNKINTVYKYFIMFFLKGHSETDGVILMFS